MDELYNLNIERAVLSAIIFDSEIFEDVATHLKSEDFYLPFHQHLFSAMERLFEKELPIDEEFLKTELQKSKKFDEVAMIEVLSANPITNTKAYVEEIKAYSNKRSLITLATEIKKLTIEEDLEAEQVMDRVEQKLYEITQNSTSDDFKDSKKITVDMLNEIERLKELGNSKLIGVDTGFVNLNDRTSGFGKGDLVIIAARPAMGKCLGIGTKVVMYDGSLKKVEDVKVGDLLMGDDSTPRRVLSIATGEEEMYWIRQNKGIDYRVNKSHILSLKRSRNEGKHKHGDILNISVEEYLKKSDKFKRNYKGYKVAIEFNEQKLEIEPYFLGIWLGDGRSSDIRVASEDKEVVEYLKDYAFRLDKKLHRYAVDGKCTMYGITAATKDDIANSLQAKLRELNLLNNKHIPHKYIANSSKNRLELLAGLIDSDGYYDAKHNVFEVVQKNYKLAKDIEYLANTLGFRVSFKSNKTTIKNRGNESEVYRVRIVGDLDKIPTKIKRNKQEKF